MKLKELVPTQTKIWLFLSVKSNPYFTKYTLSLHDEQQSQAFQEQKETQVAVNLVIISLLQFMFELIHILLEYWVYKEPLRFAMLLIFPFGNLPVLLLYLVKPSTVNFTPIILFMARIALMLFIFKY